MMWRDIILLVDETFSDNGMGDMISSKTKKQVFANKKSIRQSEFYQASANGLKPELMFEIRFADYSSEKIVEYNAKQYSIIREFSKNDEIVELVCEGVVNHGNA